MRLPHLVLKLEFQLEDRVLLRERLPPALPFKDRGQVVVAVLVVLGSELQEEEVKACWKDERLNLD